MHAIHIASMNAFPEVVKVLLAHGASAEQPDEGQAAAAPLHYAACSGSLEVGRSLALCADCTSWQETWAVCLRTSPTNPLI